jgi:hypothetical protein
MPAERFHSFQEFWPFYVLEHSRAASRALHFVGSSLALVLLASAVWYSPWLLIAVPMVGYGFAWIGHFAIEHNRPASFKYPLWSFLADWKMWALTLCGRMSGEVERARLLKDSPAAMPDSGKHTAGAPGR